MTVTKKKQGNIQLAVCVTQALSSLKWSNTTCLPHNQTKIKNNIILNKKTQSRIKHSEPKPQCRITHSERKPSLKHYVLNQKINLE